MPESEIRERLKRLEDVAQRIESALIGDPELGQKGLAARVKEIENTVASHADMVLTVKGRILGALAASTMLGGFLNWLLGAHSAK